MNLKVVVLDAGTLSRQGDVDFKAFERFGELDIYEHTLPEEAAGRMAGADIVLSNKVPVGEKELAAAPDLKLVNVCATGTDIIDKAALKRRGVALCNVAGYSTPSVTQHVFALLLNLVTQVDVYARELGQWPGSRHFTRLEHSIGELEGKTLGIVGYGEIGQAVGRVARAFGMRVVAYCREGRAGEASVERLGGEEFFTACDVISLHCPLTDETRHLINRERLSQMPRGAILINTGRGALVDSAALLEAVESGHLLGAGIDVLEEEPPPAEHPLVRAAHPRILVTPHTAWASLEARRRLLAGLEANIESFLEGGCLNRLL